MRSPRRQDRKTPEEGRFTMIEDRAAAEADVVTKLSRQSVAGTVPRLTGMITAKGMRLFAVIDQAAKARQVGLTLRATTLVIFGSPKTGTPVMAASPLAALDLPLKVLIWADQGQTKVSYYAPAMLAASHHLMLGQANTEAINRGSRYSYGEATGITQTVRNHGASVGFAILGTLLITRLRSAITFSLTAGACPGQRRQRKRPRSPSCRAATATSPPSPRSSAPTSPPPSATCSTGWPSSWLSQPSWRCAGSGGASRKTPHGPRRSSAASYPTRTQAPTSTPPGAKPGRIR
jgi:uncharacterized protein (DUF302 family)